MSTPTSPDPRERAGADAGVEPDRTSAAPAPASTGTPLAPTPTGTPLPADPQATTPLPATPAPETRTTAPIAPENRTTAPVAAEAPPAAAPVESRRTLREDPAAAEDRRLTEERRVAQDRRLEAERRDLPEPPAKPGFGRHLLGVLLGLVLTPVALLLVGIGTSRLSDVASGDATTDALGLTLLALGAVLLAVIVLLGVWSPAVPIAGGLVWGVTLGLAYLVVPDVMADAVDQMLGDRVLPAAVEQLTDSATSGQLLVTGTLLVAAGVAAAVARRVGRRWAERRAAAEQARADVERAAAARNREDDRTAGSRG